MTGIKNLMLLAVVAVCVDIGMARGSLADKACNLINGTVITTKACGCGQEELDLNVQCNLGPLTLTDTFNNDLTATFCNQPQNWTSPRPWKGVLGKACRISIAGDVPRIVTPHRCCRSATCVIDDPTKAIAFTVNGTDAVAYFCSNKLQLEDREDSSSSEDDEDVDEEGAEDQDENCINLSCGGRKGRGGRGGRRDRGRGGRRGGRGGRGSRRG